MPVPLTSSDLADRLGAIVAGLRRVLAARAARDPATAAMLLLLWGRLSRILARFSAIAARYHAGTLRRPPASRRRSASPPSPPPRDALPRRPAWIVRGAQECAVYGESLHWLLAEPAMAAMIEAAPQLRPLLRPLWRMLRLDPPPPLLQTPRAAAEPPAPRPRPSPGPRPSPRLPASTRRRTKPPVTRDTPGPTPGRLRNRR